MNNSSLQNISAAAAAGLLPTQRIYSADNLKEICNELKDQLNFLRAQKKDNDVKAERNEITHTSYAYNEWSRKVEEIDFHITQSLYSYQTEIRDMDVCGIVNANSLNYICYRMNSDFERIRDLLVKLTTLTDIVVPKEADAVVKYHNVPDIKGFETLEKPMNTIEENSGKSGPVIPLERKHALPSLETYGSSPSSSNSSSYQLTSFSTLHDVFLSFRSIDTGNELVKPLCTALKSNGIRPFYYDHELQAPDEMFSQPAIELSRLSIVVLSKNYASSTWCLYELVKILRTVRRKKQVLVPIFYDVNRSDVRHQTGEFGQTFSKHTRDLQKRVDTWKASLYEIASLSEYFYLQSGRLNPNDLLISKIIRHVKRSLLDAETPSLMNFRAREEEMEVQLDFLQTELTLSDTENLVGTVEKLLGYKLTKSKFVAIRKLELMHIWNLKLSDFPKNLSFPDLTRLCIHYSDNIDTSMIDYGIPYSFFELMPGLKSLDMSNTNIKFLPPSVTKLINLESLILRGCNLLTELPPKIESLVNLMELDVSGCTMLATYPDQSMNFPWYLRRLNIQDLKSLTKLPESITKLRSLHYLNLSGCTNLAEIPESIELLPRLSSLDLSDCKTLTKLPKSICKLKFLEDIYLSGCSSLFQSPTGLDEPEVSINRLSTNRRAAIMELQLDFPKGDGTLSDIEELLRLIKNIMEYSCQISEVVVGEKLTVMYIRNVKLSKIPNNISFPSLEMLFLDSHFDLTDIPSLFFEKMPALQVLDMSNTSIKTLPPSISKLIKLKKLFLRHCELLMELPCEIGALVNLKVMDLEGTDLASLPEELGELINLKCLKVSLYDAESYRNSKKIVAIIPEKALSKLTQLDELSINVDPQDIWCDAAVRVIIKDLPGLRNLKTLKIYLPNTVLLQDLLELEWNNTDLSIYQTLANFNIVIGPNAQHFITRLPRDLEEEFLKLKKCLKYINGEGSTAKFAEALKHANALYIDRHWTIQTLSVFRLEGLKELKYCLLVDCNKMHTVFDESDFDYGVADKADTFLSLQYLAIHYLKDLEVIWKGPSIGCCLRSLKVLTIHMCPNLNTIFTKVLLGDLVNLKEIIVEDCPKIKTLIAGDESQFTSEEILPGLKKLSLFYLPELESICSSVSIGPKLESLVIYDCPKLKKLPSMEWWNEEDIIKIKGESEWWDSLEWNEQAEGRSDQPKYRGHVFSELDEAFLDDLAPEYGNSLRLLVKDCNTD